MSCGCLAIVWHLDSNLEWVPSSEVLHELQQQHQNNTQNRRRHIPRWAVEWNDENRWKQRQDGGDVMGEVTTWGGDSGDWYRFHLIKVAGDLWEICVFGTWNHQDEICFCFCSAVLILHAILPFFDTMVTASGSSHIFFGGQTLLFKGSDLPLATHWMYLPGDQPR